LFYLKKKKKKIKLKKKLFFVTLSKKGKLK